VRNLLATIGLHLETLRRLSGPGGIKAADAAHALLARSTTLCNNALQPVRPAGTHARRRGANLPQIAREVADVLRPCVPTGFAFDIRPNGTGNVLADPDDVFRILFNLMNNAVAVANGQPDTLTAISIEVSSKDPNMTVRVSDDGPGLPDGVRARLFVVRESFGRPSSCHGHGLVIARELAERNGGTLALIPSIKGTSFALTLPAQPVLSAQDRSFGRRAIIL
jgi:signal transduction histidine kinase